MTTQQKLGTLLYLGKRYDIWLNPGQSRDFVLEKDRFVVSSGMATNPDLLNKVYDDFCVEKLTKIVEKGIEKLRTKKIKLQLDFTDGKNNFKKDMFLSVDEYLKLIDYSKKIEFKIGSFKKEWGINQVDVKHKNFILFFNLDLIKFDSGEHINYVVAHELAHIFHRDHGVEFNQILERLFPTKKLSERFFDFQVADLLKNVTSGDNQSFNLVLLAVVCLLLLFGLWNVVSHWVISIFSGPMNPTF
jgi:hypothetical protein